MHVDTPQTRCQAGVARGDITPPVGIYHRMWGAAVHDRATGVHRPLLATVLWLEPITPEINTPQVLISLDHCIIDGDEMNRIRAQVAHATAITPAYVQIALSHTHGSGWMSRSRSHLPGGDLIGPYLDNLAQRCANLSLEAKNGRQFATIVYGQGRCSLAAHRDLWDAENRQFVCGFNPHGPADDTLLFAKINTATGPLLATIVNYACHPTTLAWENTVISPDYLGAMREVIEGATGGPCLFLQGASGDLGPREGFVGEIATADRNGRVLGYATLAALELLPAPGTRFVYAGPVVSGTTIGTWKHVLLDSNTLQGQANWTTRSFQVPLPYRHDLPTIAETESARSHWLAEEAKANTAGDAQTARDCRAMVEQMTRQLTRLNAMPTGRTYPFQVDLWQLGDALWIFLPGELYQVFQIELRRRFADRPVIISTVTGDWQPGYVPAASSFGYGIYQDVIAAVGPGSLEVLIESITREVNKMSYPSA